MKRFKSGENCLRKVLNGGWPVVGFFVKIRILVCWSLWVKFKFFCWFYGLCFNLLYGLILMILWRVCFIWKCLLYNIVKSLI